MRNLISLALILAGLSFYSAAPVMSDDSGLATALHSIKRERGRLCMDGHYHYGSGSTARSKKVALRSAVNDWRSFTEWEYGSDWSHFNRAANRKPSCERAYGGGWKCSVEARPCK